MVSAVIAAGGKGTRMGADKNKVFLPLYGKTVLWHTLRVFEENDGTDEIILVVGAQETETAERIAAEFPKVAAVTAGGASRQESVYNGILKAKGDIILIHDGARALISGAEIDGAIGDCKKFGAAAVGVRSKDTLKRADGGFIAGTIDRDSCFNIHTPQVFSRDIILAAHERARADGFSATDDCMLVEKYGGCKIRITEGSYENIKLTTPEDMELAERILQMRNLR